MKISFLKIVWKRLWGGREAVFDYLLDVANTAVSRMAEGTRGEVATAVALLREARARMDALDWLVPPAWEKCYTAVTRCIDSVLGAVEDLRLSRAELEEVVSAFRAAYSEWRAE